MILSLLIQKLGFNLIIQIVIMTGKAGICLTWSVSTKIGLKSNRKAINRNWSNQKANPALKTETGKNKYYK